MRSSSTISVGLCQLHCNLLAYTLTNSLRFCLRGCDGIELKADKWLDHGHARSLGARHRFVRRHGRCIYPGKHHVGIGKHPTTCIQSSAGLQKLRLRGVPAIDSVGGPAEGLTYIVTGPTRYAPTTKAMTLQACAYNAYAARSSDSLKLSVSVELAVA